jgi:citrate synthase
MSTEPNRIPGEIKEGVYTLQGQPITTLMEKGDWTQTMALALFGSSLGAKEQKIFSACLIAAIDHGMDPPSAQVTRIVASCGKPVADSVAAGLLTLGPRHGNAASAASVWLRERVATADSVSEVVARALAEGARLSGFGHAEYERDPRAVTITELMKSLSIPHSHLEYALQVADELTKQKGKPLYLNIDGAIGAVIADFNWPSELADSLFLVARTVGLCAHALDEAKTAVRYRRGGAERTK